MLGQNQSRLLAKVGEHGFGKLSFGLLEQKMLETTGDIGKSAEIRRGAAR